MPPTPPRLVLGLLTGALALSAACSSDPAQGGKRPGDGKDPVFPEEPGGDPGGDPGAPVDGGAEVPPASCDPGSFTLHRLNRAEYDNTVRDLLGTSLRPAEEFPDDDIGYGFDNIGDVLATSPLLVEKLELAADRLIEEALAPAVGSTLRSFEAEIVGGDVGSSDGEFWNLWAEGAIHVQVELPAEGDYVLAARAAGQQAGEEPARMELLVDGASVQVFDVPATRSAPAVYASTVHLTGGEHTVSVAFINDYYDPTAGQDRNLLVDFIEVEGPVGGVPAPADGARARLLFCDLALGESCARDVLASFASKAWRRPLEGDELDRLWALTGVATAEGDSLEEGVKLAMKAVLLSPHFLFRVELDPDPSSTEPHPVTDHELAVRLSYFLWSSMPDDELRALADQGTLRAPGVLEAQIERMLADEKARAFTENFAGQWLSARAIEEVYPDANTFPDFDQALKSKMRRETELFFEHFLRSEQSALDMIDADFTFVDAALAAHYGVAIPADAALDERGFARVSLQNTGRAGVLTQGGPLLSTSYPTRTSPTKRGKWVLEHILCMPPSPPPPGVEGLIEEGASAGTVRERLEEHRSNPECASCHAIMDPIGFGVENFDATGRYRTTDQGLPINSSDVFLDGNTFTGAVELAGLMKQMPDVSRCMTTKLMTYALGRGLTPDDSCTIDRVDAAFASGGYRMKDLVRLIAESDAFQNRRGAGEP